MSARGIPLQFKEVTKSFGHERVLDRVSFEIESGERVFLLGKSGVGKSVTLKHLVGLLQPDSGEVWVGAHRVDQANEVELIEIRKKCGLIFQQPALFDFLSVGENIQFGNPNARARDILKLVHLEDEVWEMSPQTLSFGMQKRVSIARTLNLYPSALLFDEPTTGLDPFTSDAIHELILELSETLKVTSLVISHDLKSALKYASRILVIDQGRILVDSSPEDFMSSKYLTIPLVAQFLRSSGVAVTHA